MSASAERVRGGSASRTSPQRPWSPALLLSRKSEKPCAVGGMRWVSQAEGLERGEAVNGPQSLTPRWRGERVALVPRAPATGSRGAVDPKIEEVRVAMALNGGVSLAVWMGGCAVELDSARRAHLGPEDLSYRAAGNRRVSPRGTGERRVYHALCSSLRRRFVLDILTGASAGGINGALLGAAMKADGRLHPDFIRTKWLTLGDFSKMLHDPRTRDPDSLMQGELFHRHLVETFRQLLGRGRRGPTGQAKLPRRQKGHPVEIPHLEITMTDLAGEEHEFTDEWGHDLIAREYRARFKFSRRGHFTAGALARAARTSASFPIAFEPSEVDGEARERAGLSSDTLGIDGGLLDNAPIKAALDLIPGRPATTQVQRHVCYLNADPPMPEQVHASGGLKEVAAGVVGLPRKAPFVDQLYAIERATQRWRQVRETQQRLLEMDLDALSAAAEALFPTYRERRLRLSLEELLPGPAQVDFAQSYTNAVGLTPAWIPQEFGIPGPGDWTWGVRPAQRVLQLVIDLLRPLIAAVDPGPVRTHLLGARLAIYSELERLGRAHEGLVGDDPSSQSQAAGERERGQVVRRLDAAHGTAEGIRETAYSAVERAAEIFYGICREQHPRFGFLPLVPLYGPNRRLSWDRQFKLFLRRVLAMEVLRRAFPSETDLDSDQELKFAQLTPFAAAPIFTDRPLSEFGPSTPAEKLTGLKMGHFAGFYKQAWRANDFMWGRLDSSVRIVDLLTTELPMEVRFAAHQGGPGSPGAEIAHELLADDESGDQRWLILEALRERQDEQAEGRETLRAELALDALPLERILARELNADLAGDNPVFTRAVCARAVQLEVVRDELPQLVETSYEDRRDGSSAAPLELPLGESVRPAVDALRTGESLPKRLTGPGELTSDLAVRTATRSAFVGLGALHKALRPAATAVSTIRPILLALAGVVSKSFWYRAITALGFWAAALYIATRLVSAQNADPVLTGSWWQPVFVGAIAVLVAVGVFLVPAARAFLSKAKRPANVIWALGLAATGGAVGGLLAWGPGHLNVSQIVFARRNGGPSDDVLAATAVVALGLSASRLRFWQSVPVGKVPGIKDLVDRYVNRPWAGWPTAIALVIVSVLVAVPSIQLLGEQLDEETWRAITAGMAVFGAPLFAIAYLLIRPGFGGRRGRKIPGAG